MSAEQSGGQPQASRKLTAGELTRQVLDSVKYDYGLIAEPMDTGLWPTEGFSGLNEEQRNAVVHGIQRGVSALRESEQLKKQQKLTQN